MNTRRDIEEYQAEVNWALLVAAEKVANLITPFLLLLILWRVW